MAEVLQFLPTLLLGVRVTVLVTVLGMIFSVVFALLGGLGRLSKRRPVRWLAGAYIEVFRGTSVLVQMFWLFYVFPRLFDIELSPLFAGVLALSMNVGAYGSEVVRGAILAVPKGQTEAAIACNFSPSQRLRRIVLPQAVVAMLPPFGNLMIELLKGTALVSLITLSDLTFMAQQVRALTGATLQVFTIVLVLYFVMSYAITLGVRFLERRVSVGRDVGRHMPQPIPEPVA